MTEEKWAEILAAEPEEILAVLKEIAESPTTRPSVRMAARRIVEEFAPTRRKPLSPEEARRRLDQLYAETPEMAPGRKQR